MTKTLFFVNRESPAAQSLIRKMADQHRNGAIVLLSHDEYEALKNDVIVIHFEETAIPHE